MQLPESIDFTEVLRLEALTRELLRRSTLSAGRGEQESGFRGEISSPTGLTRLSTGTVS
jgi:hypothetical protein